MTNKKELSKREIGSKIITTKPLLLPELFRELNDVSGCRLYPRPVQVSCLSLLPLHQPLWRKPS